jgi:hypothetical protein
LHWGIKDAERPSGLKERYALGALRSIPAKKGPGRGLAAGAAAGVGPSYVIVFTLDKLKKRPFFCLKPCFWYQNDSSKNLLCVYYIKNL